MATHRNVTLSLPIKVLRQVKRIAEKREISLSELLSQALEELAMREEGYAQAQSRHLTWLAQATDLGTNGQIAWSRESLHER
jgi:hypothetical protein